MPTALSAATLGPGPGVSLAHRQRADAVMDTATVSVNLGLRLTAARIIGQSDRRRAVLLIARELENRSVAACRQAVTEFNALTAKNDRIDCTNLAERTSTRARWMTLARE